MEMFRNNLKEVGGVKITKILDYQKGVDGLPKSNVLKMFLEDGTTFVVRPSGTEPKLKIYISIVGKSGKENANKAEVIFKALEPLLK